MRRILSLCLFVLLCFVCLALPAVAQTETGPDVAIGTNFAALGMSYTPSATPSVAGTALYARPLSESKGTYSFTVLDALPTSTKPFLVTTQTATGIAQRVAKIRDVSVYVPAAAGVSWSGQNTGWAWSTGAIAMVPVKGRYIMPNVRVQKSSVNNYSGYQLTVGVMYGFRF